MSNVTRESLKIEEVEVEGLKFKVVEPVTIMTKIKKKGPSFYILIPIGYARKLELKNNDPVIVTIVKVLDVTPAEKSKEVSVKRDEKNIGTSFTRTS